LRAFKEWVKKKGKSDIRIILYNFQVDIHVAKKDAGFDAISALKIF
jgi:hypothetical protein